MYPRSSTKGDADPRDRQPVLAAAFCGLNPPLSPRARSRELVDARQSMALAEELGHKHEHTIFPRLWSLANINVLTLSYCPDLRYAL
jgi:hypothetical protein